MNDLLGYFCHVLISRYCEKAKMSREHFYASNDFSKLKLTKLHFLASSLNKEFYSKFTFYAMRLGPVAVEVYKALESNSIKNFSVGQQILATLPNSEWLLTPNDMSLVDSAVAELTKINFNLLKMSDFEIVKVTHRWQGWAITFKEAKLADKWSKTIDPNLILKDLKPVYYYGRSY